MTIDDIIEFFSFLDDWEDRYRYLIELGRDLPPFPEAARTAANKVDGCASQVWLDTRDRARRRRSRPDLHGRQRRSSRQRPGRGSSSALFGTPGLGNPRDRRPRRPRSARPSRTSDAATLQRPSLDGRPYPLRGGTCVDPSLAQPSRSASRGKKRRPEAAFSTSEQAISGDQPRLRRCWPRPIFLASCERAWA